ncbi:MAG: hypothetical protein VX834_06530, partial [Myxococcota bacterium]|nr:hypothetical protein [Myxococcota bacterium]
MAQKFSIFKEAKVVMRLREVCEMGRLLRGLTLSWLWLAFAVGCSSEAPSVTSQLSLRLPQTDASTLIKVYARQVIRDDEGLDRDVYSYAIEKGDKHLLDVLAMQSTTVLAEQHRIDGFGDTASTEWRLWQGRSTEFVPDPGYNPEVDLFLTGMPHGRVKFQPAFTSAGVEYPWKGSMQVEVTEEILGNQQPGSLVASFLTRRFVDMPADRQFLIRYSAPNPGVESLEDPVLQETVSVVADEEHEVHLPLGAPPSRPLYMVDIALGELVNSEGAADVTSALAELGYDVRFEIECTVSERTSCETHNDVWQPCSALPLSAFSEDSYIQIRYADIDGYACTVHALSLSCGDGLVFGDELCDDGGESALCDLDCSPAECGDGMANSAAGEACDTAGESETCNNDCSLAACGDSVVNAAAGEGCDDGNQVLESCDYDSAGCTVCDPTCQLREGIVPACGDGIVQAEFGEGCDDGNTLTEACDYGEASCPTVCGESCQDVVALPRFCGDGTVDSADGEGCDDGNTLTESCVYGEVACIVCNEVCEEIPGETSFCGDGEVDAQEECDDGNTLTEDCAYGESSCQVCGPLCTFAEGVVSVCGDGVVDSEAGEECDDGNTADGDSCSSTCSLGVCGDGVLRVGLSPGEEGYEACDDGNTIDDGNGCSADCQSNSICGDGIVQPLFEYCDDGYTDACGTCNADCTAAGTGATCGDGVYCPELEICDDGADTATCNAGCSLPVCGDGYVNAAAGETCDDAGESSGCNTDCTLAVCGDGNLNTTAGEVCDDGQESATCNLDCTAAVCGDGYRNPAAGEACDDGGESAACNLDCTTSQCGDGIFNATAGEACDTAGASASCNDNCTIPGCGDGIVNTEAGEECDAGGVQTAECDIDCTFPVCTDGIHNPLAGEDCDEGEDSYLCDASCQHIGDFIIALDLSDADDLTVSLPLASGYDYNFTVDWGDGSTPLPVDVAGDANATHTYANTGTYVVRLLGTLPSIRFGDSAEAHKLVAVENLGATGWQSFERAFADCPNLTRVVGGDTTGVTSMSYMFANSPLVQVDTAGWDTS